MYVERLPTAISRSTSGHPSGLPCVRSCSPSRPILLPLAPALLFSFACTGVLGGNTGDTSAGDAPDPCVWYRDQDGDGFGDPTHEEPACDKPAGYVEDKTDCDDQDPKAHPGAKEICDAVDADEDCDGMADEEDDSLTLTTWYADADRDGYGDPEDTTDACDPPEGFVDNADDCDDTERTINPDGQEVCDGNGGDEDCDGLVDSDDDSMDDSVLPYWYEDNDNDNYGDPSSSPRHQCDAPSGYAANDEDCDDGDKNVNPGETETCGNGQDDNCDGSGNGCGLTGDIDLTTADVRIAGPANGNLGYSLAGVGDLDNDGLDDIVVGAFAYFNDGTAYAFYGGASGALNASSADVTFTGESSGNSFGFSVEGGDLNKDGKADVIIGDPEYTYSSSYSSGGRVYLFTSSLPSSEAAGSANTIWTNNYGSFDELGYSLTVGDWNGDAKDDAFFGCVERFVYGDFGTISSSTGNDITSLNEFEGTLSGDYIGDVASGGDLDGDGSDDLAVANLSASAGAVTVYSGEFTGAVDLTTKEDATINGTKSGDSFGYHIAIDGDLNGDGYADLLAGAIYAKGDETSSGVAYGCFGPLSGSSLASDCDLVLKGASASDAFGFDVAYIGDENVDGEVDILIGAPGADGKVAAAGAAYLFDGPFSAGSLSASAANATLLGISASGSLGAAVDGAGDFNGDGASDLLVGGYSVKGADGAVYIVFGGGL